jgi:hypothetical protein
MLALVLATAACGAGQDESAGGAVTASAVTGSPGSGAAGAATPPTDASTPGVPASGTPGSGGSASGTPGSGAPAAEPPGSGAAGGTTPGATPSKRARVDAPNTSQLRKNVSRPQRRFVARNAPPGIDAEAILQAGEDTCHRMGITVATAGTTSLAVALVSGQIGNGREAITYLCPRLKPALDRAEGGFPDGNYVVGSRQRDGVAVVAGRYTDPQPSTQCTWSVTGADGTAVPGQGTATVTLRAGQRFASSGCFAWLRS